MALRMQHLISRWPAWSASRMCWRDDIVRGQPVMGVFGPLAGLDTASLASGVRTLAERRPSSRMAWSYVGHHWIRHEADLDRRCDAIVHAAEPPTRQALLPTALAFVPTVSPRRPIRLILAGPYLIQVADHALGDADSIIKRVSTIASLALGEQDIAWFRTARTPFPLTRALFETFVRNPHTTLRMLEARRAANRAYQRPSGQTAPGRTHPWTPQRSMVHAASPRPVQKRMRQWMRDAGTMTTLASTYAVLMYRAFVAAGIDTRSEETVLVDLRRYLPRGSGEVQGNFLTGIVLPDLDTADPDSAGRFLHQVLSTGRPLASLAAGELIYRRRTGPVNHPTTAPSRPHANLVFSNIGLSRGLQSLPWTGPPEDRICALMGDPLRPEQVTIQLAILHGVVHMTASFHDNVFDRTAVEQAVQTVADDPFPLLGLTGGPTGH